MKLWSVLMVLSTLLLMAANGGSAHEIHLKNGSIIKTSRVERQGDRVTYEQYGGKVSISLSEVAEIRYGVPAARKPRQRINPGTTESAGPAVVMAPIPVPIQDNDPVPAPAPNDDRDLAARLAGALPADSPVAAASHAVVWIKTEAGSGSGFFVNDAGLIVTNRHVVRGSEQNKRRIETQLTETENQLNRRRAELNQSRSRLDAYEKKLDSDRRLFNQRVAEFGKRINPQWQRDVEQNLREREQHVQQWRREIQQQTAEFDKYDRQFRQQRDEWRFTNEQLARQSRFRIILADGSEQSAVLYRVSDSYDLALLKLNGFRTPFLKAAPSEAASYGRQVFAIGSPLELNNSVTAGVVSGLRDHFIQTDARIYPGNSGGPLITEDGLVLGVNTMKLITEKFEGIGFAISYHQVVAEFKDYFPR